MRIVIRLAAATFIAAFAAMPAGPAAAKEWKKIVIGTEGAYPPFNMIDSSGKVQGFDIDIALAICEHLKVECEIVTQEWDGIIPGLLAGKYDAIFASMSITEERKKTIDFSDKYYQSPTSFVVGKDSGLTDISPEALKGRSIGAQGSTIQANHLEENYQESDTSFYPTAEEPLALLADGRLDAVLIDKLVAYDWLNTEAGRCCQFAGEDIPIGGGVGAGIRKEDQDLKALINKGIEAIRADGTYEKINAKYFPFSIY